MRAQCRTFARHRRKCSLTWSKLEYCVRVGRLFQAGRKIMNEDPAKSRLDIGAVGDITKQLNDGQLSRHGLRELLTALGVGFGAAFMLGLTGAQASPAPEATVALKSTNPA